MALWWRRAVAFAADNLVIGLILGFLLQGIFHIVTFHANGKYTVAPISGRALMLFGLLWVAYFTFTNGGVRGQSLGKRIMGIAVRDVGGGQIGAARAMFRSLFVLFLWYFVIPLVVDSLWPLWDRQGQALHDKMARTLVVEV